MAIAAEKLKEGTQVLVRGKVTFSRIAKLIEGAELERSIANEKKFSTYPTKVPHVRIALVDAQIIPVSRDGQLSLEEQYVQERFYTVKKGDNQGRTAYTSIDKSGNIPIVFAPEKKETGETVHRQVTLESDLDTGMDVTLVLDIFKPKDYEKRGIGMTQIVCNEPVRYYNPTGIPAETMNVLGITVEGPIQRVDPKVAAQTVPDAPAPEDSATETIPEGSVTTDDGLVMPGPGGAPAEPAPAPQPAPAAVQAAAPAQPAQAAAPAAAPTEDIEALKARLAQLEAANQQQPTAQPGDGSPFGAMQSNAGIGF